MQPEMRPRIALIHALSDSVGPCRAAFARLWPEAYCFDLLDTSLSQDRAAIGQLDASIMHRVQALADYAEASGGEAGTTQALLFTCSAFGPAIESVQRLTRLPVFKPNEAAFIAAVTMASSIGLVVTFEASFESLSNELRRYAEITGRSVAIQGVVAKGALTALQAGDGARHDTLVAEAAATLRSADMIVLGQFSLARAAQEVERRTCLPVITTPEAAVLGLRRALGARQSARTAQG
ncbi:aspartate/glutamate racemase family protein [Sphingobium sp. HBC34]|uniref:Aspartate/glutamate racemase family protein n=1 Tax=Sphingobium cyanobacteriorum TaxID=3063954 RepID=A0ABT8ZSK7_9SPHN|nr:aspartate/glutamate racemase family protein [Sphingobium sp. HBC34]MDO7837522.1 aspartate/glutamate racemase family protein [Sphingobium sp. HBC34]